MNKHLEVRQAEMRKRWAKSSALANVRVEHTAKNSMPSASKPTHSDNAITTVSRARKAEIGPKLDLLLEYRVCSDLFVSQERAYSESYLPLTTKTAEESQCLIDQELRQFPKGWPFQDKVLVWLAPTFREDVRHFHRNNGPSIAGIFKEHQLEHLDRDLAKQLRERVQNLTLDRRTD